MVNKTQGKKNVKEEKIFNSWADSYTAVSKMWEDSYVKLYRPWIESTEEMFEKTTILSKEAAPQKYREFYDEWIKTYQNTFGKFYPLPTLKSNKETLEKFITNADGYNELYKSWIKELESNTQKTKEILSGKPDPVKYKKCNDMWIRSYEKIFDEILELPTQEKTKEIFGNYIDIPDYPEVFLQMSKLWKKSYAQFCKPLDESIMKLSEKMAQLASTDAGPEAYKEFYDMWMETYNEIYGKYAASMEPSSETFKDFVKSTDIYLGMYKSWIAALEKMSEKALELSKQNSDPAAYKQFYNLWIKIYQKAFDDFFEDMPNVGGPMKEAMEPVKIMAKMYTDTVLKMSKAWMRPNVRSASAYPGKKKSAVR